MRSWDFSVMKNQSEVDWFLGSRKTLLITCLPLLSTHLFLHLVGQNLNVASFLLPSNFAEFTDEKIEAQKNILSKTTQLEDN